MQTTMAIEEIQISLPELLATLAPGDEVILTRDRRPVGRLIGGPARAKIPRRPGNCRGMIALLVEDDDHLDGFADYMP